MKRFYTWAIVAGLCFASSLPAAHAQGNGNGKGNEKKEAATEKEDTQDKGNRERNQHNPFKAKDNVKQKAEANRGKSNDNGKANKQEKEDNNENKGKGNAYGKNKGELSGREFGQARAAAAKQNGQDKRAELTQVVTEGDTKVTEARGRLSRAIEELERKRKAGSITDTEYNEKKVTISRTEKAIQVLEERINAAKVLVSAPEVE